jgi:5-formyltetrahydrofolate cyclo-ligase
MTTSGTELRRAKRDVRRRVLAERDAMPPAERAHLADAATERFLGLPEVSRAKIVLAFWSFGSELATASLIAALHERGIVVALPRIVDGDLEARSYRPGDPVTRTTFGAFEPAAGRVIDPGDIDLIAVPAVAFDREGRRVGYGGGFYDRFLAKTRGDAARVGIAFSVQLSPPGLPLPAGHFDLRVHVVVTELETVRVGAST